MNEYFLHGKAFVDSGGYKEISVVIKAESASDAHRKATEEAIKGINGVTAAVFDVMTKM